MIREKFVFELTCRYDNRQSFYRKAEVIEFEDESKALRSYSTIVACITPDGKPHVRGDYSQTTTRHIKEFLKQSCFRADSKQQYLKEYFDEEFSWEKFMSDRSLY